MGGNPNSAKGDRGASPGAKENRARWGPPQQGPGPQSPRPPAPAPAWDSAKDPGVTPSPEHAPRSQNAACSSYRDGPPGSGSTGGASGGARRAVPQPRPPPSPCALPRQCRVGKRKGGTGAGTSLSPGCPTWCLTGGNQGCACASPRLDRGGVGELPQTCCRPAAASATGPAKCGAWAPPTAPAEKAPSKGPLSLPLTQNLKKKFF